MGRFIDGRERGADVETDVCVIGAGAAGISVALELIGAPFDVALVEAGGLELDPDYQELYRSEQIGLRTDALQHNRWRVFGGTTGHWGGWCRPLDPIDFERRSWVPHSGWPFGFSELKTAYSRAAEICEVDDVYDAEAVTEPADHARGLYLRDDAFENIVFQVSPPTRFGTRYRPALEAAKNVDVYLHSSAVDFVLDEHGGRVVAAKIKTLKGGGYLVRARRFVLAAGAVENARLLLHADGVHRTGLGNTRDRVGRCFMQHVQIRELRWIADSPDARERFGRGTSKPTTGLAARYTQEVQRRHGMLNHHLLLAGFSDSVPESILDWAKKTYRARRDQSPVDRAVESLLLDLGREPAPNDTRHVYAAAVMERPEQSPNPASRITLSEERDALGVRRVVMDWRLTELDLHTLRTGHRLLAQSLGRRDWGRLKGWPDGFDLTAGDAGPLHGGHHHLGTTRMHASPSEGVVDPSCRLHGVDNLYLAGASTFPTSGYANPTLTIVAMSVRLARELRRTPGSADVAVEP